LHFVLRASPWQYYACILPSLLFFASPFAFLWNGVHLILAPGASHSGWEVAAATRTPCAL